MARALLTQSSIIVLDEPSEGLAPMTIQDTLLPQLQTLNEQGITVLIAEQNLSLALQLAERNRLDPAMQVLLDNLLGLLPQPPARWMTASSRSGGDVHPSDTSAR